jgi:hypothetical protein
LIFTLTHEDSLDSVEGSPANAHSLSRAYEGMHGAWNLSPDRRSEVLDLYIGDRSPLPLITHEAEYAWSPQYLQPLLCRLRDANEGIATKQWGFHLAPPVAPLADLLEKREKREDSLYLKLLGNPLFMPRPSMDCIPVRFFRRETQWRK